MIYRRLILDDIRKWILKDEIIILTGPRQSGKTTILKILYNELKNKHKCFFLSLEDLNIVSIINEHPENIFKIIPKSKSSVFVFIDEIQYLNNPSNFLKYIYDLYDNIKLIVSGSSAFYIDKKFNDSLAGRKKIFNILPLNFSDFLIFKEKEELLERGKKILSLENNPSEFLYYEKQALNELFNEYMIFGSYPKVVIEKDPEIKKELLRELVNSYIKKDVLESELSSAEKFFNLLKILSYRTGNLLNKNELSALIGLSTPSISNYLYIMEKSFHIKLVPPFFKNIKKEITKMHKIYFYDMGLRNSLLNNFSPLLNREDRGQLFENFAFKIIVDNYGIDEIRYWRKQSGTEIDFIIPYEKKAIEVKFRKSLIKRGQLKSFMNLYEDFLIYLMFLNDENIPEIINLELK